MSAVVTVGVMPVNLEFKKVRIQLLGAVQGKSPQSLMLAQARSGFSSQAKPSNYTVRLNLVEFDGRKQL